MEVHWKSRLPPRPPARRTAVLPVLCLAVLALTTCRDGPTGPRTTPLGSPDVIFVNGQVLTMEPDRPVAGAVAVGNGLILEVGDDQAVLELRTAETQVIDLGGLALLPGFVDAHNHVFHSVFFQSETETVGTTYDEGQQAMLAVGTTTHGNPGGFPDFAADFMEFAEGGGLRVRASLYLQYNNACGDRHEPVGWYDAFPPVADPARMFRLPGIKAFTDGGACAQPAMSLPETDPYGDLFVPAEELAEAVEAAHRMGFQVAIHALGDRALDTVFVALESALAAGPAPHPPRIEHNRIVRPDQLPRYAELGALPVVFGQPFTCQIIDGGAWSALQHEEHWVAPARPWFDPWRAVLDANPGRPVAWHSDFRFFALEPLTHVWSLVTRREVRPDGSVCEPPDWLAEAAIEVDEALRMMTVGGAHALLMEDHVGSLRAGKFADLVVLSQNPLDADLDEIRHIQVLMTMVGGRVEHCLPGHGGICPD